MEAKAETNNYTLGRERESKLVISIRSLLLELRELHDSGSVQTVEARRIENPRTQTTESMKRAYSGSETEAAIMKPAWVCSRSSAYILWFL